MVVTRCTKQQLSREKGTACKTCLLYVYVSPSFVLWELQRSYHSHVRGNAVFRCPGFEPSRQSWACFSLRFLFAWNYCTFSFDKEIKDRWQKGVHPPKSMTKRGALLFVDREVFDVHVVVGINPMAQQDVCASMVHYSSHIHHQCIRTAKRPTACGTSTLLSKKPNVRTGSISDLRTGSVCFIQEDVSYYSVRIERRRKNTSHWSLSCNHGLHCSDELMWEQEQQQRQQQQQQQPQPQPQQQQQQLLLQP